MTVGRNAISIRIKGKEPFAFAEQLKAQCTPLKNGCYLVLVRLSKTKIASAKQDVEGMHSEGKISVIVRDHMN